MRFSKREKSDFLKLTQQYLMHKKVQQMREYIQHGSITTYDHVIRVAEGSFLLNRRLHLHCRESSLVTGALLHDFYLYDWHDPGKEIPLHGFYHPKAALEMADHYFELDDKEKNIIRSHMWPLTFLNVPRCREAAVVCMVDKYVSTRETVGGYRDRLLAYAARGKQQERSCEEEKKRHRKYSANRKG